jgi:hypothetical protein
MMGGQMGGPMMGGQMGGPMMGGQMGGMPMGGMPMGGGYPPAGGYAPPPLTSAYHQQKPHYRYNSVLLFESITDSQRRLKVDGSLLTLPSPPTSDLLTLPRFSFFSKRPLFSERWTRTVVATWTKRSLREQ